MKSLFIFQITSLSKIHGKVIPGSKSINILRPLVLNARLIFKISELVIDSAGESPLTVPALGVYFFLK